MPDVKIPVSLDPDIDNQMVSDLLGNQVELNFSKDMLAKRKRMLEHLGAFIQAKITLIDKILAE